MPSTPTLEQLPQTFDEWWSAPGFWVEEPNQARSGWSGVMRVYCGQRLYYVKKQRNYTCRTLSHPLGWPTVSREFRNIMWLAVLGLHVPNPVFHGSRKNGKATEAILVTEELCDFIDLDHLPEMSDAQKVALARLAGEAIGTLHRAGFRHGCLYGKHLMARWIDGQPEIALIDLEKLRRAFFPKQAIRHDLDQLKRRQNIWSPAHWQELLTTHRQTLEGTPASRLA